ncbi:hypothetical protein VFPFJ_06283 [Purpureocillium lilacinum]|uniref:Uncharacterized protein n=1 Tax=Purpureocillium lilacinum TaxID=33203 RepID=A0A179HK70_PURLI|nr:hypothetical protein VFPFJ_06283 [Purpureocillium lilacinum]OAQ87824.1 hypothetical protein VFPBJ_01865 [Purpureocillium lilacinum]OAQ89869.1 hypothetical protein VFPFJ_06283 [Purpureocillium lilacinum]
MYERQSVWPWRTQGEMDAALQDKGGILREGRIMTMLKENWCRAGCCWPVFCCQVWARESVAGDGRSVASETARPVLSSRTAGGLPGSTAAQRLE